MTITPPPSRVTIGVLALQGAFHEHLHCLQRLRIDGVDISAVPVRTTAALEACDALIIPGGESTVMSRLAGLTPGLLPALQAFVRDPARAVWGTCAGMILMADAIGGGRGAARAGAGAGKGDVVAGWGGVPGLRVWRNLYGGQLESFECALEIPALGPAPFPATFIRAPAVHSLVLPSPDGGSPASADAPAAPGEPGAPGPPGTPELEILATVPPAARPAPPPADSPLGPADPALLPAAMLRHGRKLVCAFHPELGGDARVCEFWVARCVLGRTT